MVTACQFPQASRQFFYPNSVDRFLLARLQLDHLANHTNPLKIRRALGSLPLTLNDTYNDAILRIQAQAKALRELAMQVLAWISHAKRPLLVDELIHALSIEPGATELDETGFEEADTLIDVCIGLVSMDNGSGVIRLVHYTLQEHLIANRKTLFPDAEIMITRACLAYLSLNAFEYDPDGDDSKDDDVSNYDYPENQDMHSSYPYASALQVDQIAEDPLVTYKFLHYAAWAWGDHARLNAETKLEKNILRYFEKEQRTIIPYLGSSRYYCEDEVRDWSEHGKLRTLHKAAAWGFETVVNV